MKRVPPAKDLEVAKCLRCGCLYTRLKYDVCQQCELAEEKEIFRIQQYLREHDDLSLVEVSDALDIYIDDIERWIAEKRLAVTFQKASLLKCVLCNTPIITGRICARCSDRVGLKPTKAAPGVKPKRIEPAPNLEPGAPPGGPKKYKRS